MLAVAFVSASIVSVAAIPPDEQTPAAPAACVGDCVSRTQLERSQRLAAKRLRGWRYSARRAYGLKRTLLHAGSVSEAINLACATYGHCATLWRKARCETGGTFDPGARNPSGASGLFQFLPSTWASTPYAGLSVFSAYANALAAGWMHAHGRGSEWVCR